MNDANGRRTSLGKFSYALRPAKNIERKMLCEAFGCLACIAPVRTYRYIGFGSVEFVDFGLVHQRLGISDMISIESRKDAQERVNFNRPYSCIRIEWDESSVVLPTLEWRKKTIIWLDYDHCLDTGILDDVTLVMSSLVSGSIIVVTVEAEPRKAEGDPDIGKVRLRTLIKNVGEDRLPVIDAENGGKRPLRGADLANWGLATISQRIINDEIATTLKDRNGGCNKRWRVSYEQLFNFHYADGAKMLTVGGIVVHSNHKSKIPEHTFDSLEFVRRDDAPYLIESPVLTLRELRYLDNHLTPRGFTETVHRWLPRTECDRYRRVYRYFPTFLEVEA